MSYQRTLTTEEQDQALAYIVNPSKFVRKYLKSRLWFSQDWILNSISRFGRTAVKACHSSGKTFAAALAVIWWVVRWDDGIAVTTAPTWLQVEKLLWAEIHKAVERGTVGFPSDPNVTELEISSSNYALGLSTNEAERFQGFHEGHVLIVLDEAPGVKTPIWEAIEGIRAGGDVRVLALGNPTIAAGPFYEAFSTHRATWETHSISAFNTPNLSSLFYNDQKRIDSLTDEELMEVLGNLNDKQLDSNKFPKLTNRRWVMEKWTEWGLVKSPLWDARVMGRFPQQSAEQLFPLMYLEQARYRPIRIRASDEINVGIDVAGPGEDETVMYVVQGYNILEHHAFRDSDARGPVVKILNEYRKYQPRVKVDKLGLGHYFTEHIRDCGFDVVGINIQDTEVSDPDRFKDQKAEYSWGLRELLEDGKIRGLTDEETISQLSVIQYGHDSKGRVFVRSKDWMRKQGMKSPDRAEALILAYAPITANSEVAFV